MGLFLFCDIAQHYTLILLLLFTVVNCKNIKRQILKKQKKLTEKHPTYFKNYYFYQKNR